jgi:predicted anti-sigma-YlaC factor YlaD
MECLSAERIYRYLDGDLSPEERTSLENHFAACPGCGAAVETRRRIAEAAAALPAFEVPDDFAAGIMVRIEEAPASAKPRSALLAWLAAAVAGGVSLGGTFVLIAVLAGHSLTQAIARLNDLLWDVLRGAAFYSIKGLKVLVLFAQMVVQLIGHAIEALRTTMAALSPVLPVVAFGLTVLILVTAGLWLGWRRHYSRAEKTHEN